MDMNHKTLCCNLQQNVEQLIGFREVFYFQYTMFMFHLFRLVDYVLMFTLVRAAQDEGISFEQSFRIPSFPL